MRFFPFKKKSERKAPLGVPGRFSRPEAITAIALAALLAACAAERMNVFSAPPKENLHKACETCHLSADPQKDGRLFRAGTEPSMVCIYCHHYGKNHHPFGIVPNTENYFVDCGMSELPLFDEEIRCLTCHQAHGGLGLDETPHLLRGGPYNDRRAFCFQCHFKEKYADVYVHRMLEADGSYVTIKGEPICLFCHEAVPNPRIDKTDDVSFKADVAFLCWRCHPPMPGAFFSQHFLVQPDDAYLRQMTKAEREKNVILPLVPRNRITCSTCHNPHQDGVMVRRAAQAGADAPARLRLEKIDLCMACHEGN